MRGIVEEGQPAGYDSIQLTKSSVSRQIEFHVSRFQRRRPHDHHSGAVPMTWSSRISREIFRYVVKNARFLERRVRALLAASSRRATRCSWTMGQ